ncbi:MAG: two-component system phosphate regulon response regulator PhoB [Halieaceae bacterium]|jgi:two-component system phosphate regulon response regulator PhoB
MNEHTVLVVDDESAIRDMLRMVLDIAGFGFTEAENIQDAHVRVLEDKPDIILLDWMLPGGSGIELLRRLKRDEHTRDLPVIMLTAKTSEDNIVQGLDVGADDYITKPFAPRELVARIKSLLRRSAVGENAQRLQMAELVLDQESHRIFLGEDVVEAGPTEYRLLRFFMSHPERAYSRANLLDSVWGVNVYVEERTVDVHIRRLRMALKTSTLDYSHLIQTVRGTGYRFSSRDLMSVDAGRLNTQAL